MSGVARNLRANTSMRIRVRTWGPGFATQSATKACRRGHAVNTCGTIACAILSNAQMRERRRRAEFPPVRPGVGMNRTDGLVEQCEVGHGQEQGLG
jgi:hypothetical protein